MSEVERYWIDPSRLVQEGWHQDDTCVVKGWAYYRAVAERDALQQRLTVADERVDMLGKEVERLSRVKLSLKDLAESRADNCSVYREHLNEALTMAKKVRDASPGMQRKCLSDLIVYLSQNSGAALNPVDGGGDDA